MGRITKASRVREYAAARGWARIGGVEWNELRDAMPDIGESTLRSAGLPISQPWRGVRQHSLDELQESLTEMSGIYAARPDLRKYCRDQVIAAKDRARRLSATKVLKAEMVEWMLVWLDDPAMFTAWAHLRRKQTG